MWPSWGKSPSSNKKNFSCTSFKDIHSLFPEPPPLGQSHPKKPSLFRRVRFATSLLRAWSVQPKLLPPPPPPPDLSQITLPGTENLIVIYFTSLRVVRKTFEDCKTVRSIFRSFRIPIDERDLSMDSGFLDELHEIFTTKKKLHQRLTLPRVFIGGRYIGGADEIRQLHETGELKKTVEDFHFPTVQQQQQGVCEDCGGYRFVVCSECHGSHKLFTEKGGGGFRSCLDCNESGLVRCLSCSFVPS